MSPLPSRPFQWAYGLTTIPQRVDSLLPRTIASLREAGFDKPRIFIDGGTEEDAKRLRDTLGLEVTHRTPAILTVGNWFLGMIELYIRNPHAQRYIIFQDDLIVAKNLRSYLEKLPYPNRGYGNLYTVPENAKLVPTTNGQKTTGWHKSNQLGRGALALVFDNTTLIELLSARSIMEKPKHAHRGWRNLDGAILTALQSKGIQEYVHYPSLVQHTGTEVSSMGTSPRPISDCFLGESYDTLLLLPKSTKC